MLRGVVRGAAVGEEEEEEAVAEVEVRFLESHCSQKRKTLIFHRWRRVLNVGHVSYRSRVPGHCMYTVEYPD